MPATLSSTAPASEQSEFEFLLNAPGSLLRPDQVAEIIGYEKDAVYELILAGELEAHKNKIEHRLDPKAPLRGTNRTYRITRRSVLARMARTAQYAPADFLKTVLHLCRALSPNQRRELVQLLLTLPR